VPKQDRTIAGLRPSLAIGLVVTLFVGAAVLSYAALSSNGGSSKPQGKAGGSGPSPAQSAATSHAQVIPDRPTAGATGTTAPAVVPARPRVGTTGTTGMAGTTTTTTTAVPAHPTVVTTTPKLPAVTPTPTPPVAEPKTTPTGTTSPAKPTPVPAAAIALASGAVTTYDPYGAPATSFGSPAKAVDGDLLTSWTYQLDPASAGRTKVGLAVNLKPATLVGTIKILTDSPGMNIELYAATGPEPSTITSRSWIHVTNRSSIGESTTVALPGKRPIDHLLVWITRAPAGVTTGTLGIADLSLTK